MPVDLEIMTKSHVITFLESTAANSNWHIFVASTIPLSVELSSCIIYVKFFPIIMHLIFLEYWSSSQQDFHQCLLPLLYFCDNRFLLLSWWEFKLVSGSNNKQDWGYCWFYLSESIHWMTSWSCELRTESTLHSFFFFGCGMLIPGCY